MITECRKDKLEAFLASLADTNWRETDDMIHKYMLSLEEDVFDYIFFEEGYKNVLKKVRIISWLSTKFLSGAIFRYTHKSDRVLRESELSQAKELILSEGLYTDISILDYVARNDEGEVQRLAAQLCSIEALRDITGAKSGHVRKIVFQRLGPAECLNMMLKDKMASVREEGVKMAPVGYEKLGEMTGEIARGPFSALVGKISSEYLPMLLANRNLRNKWISQKLENRLALEDYDV